LAGRTPAFGPGEAAWLRNLYETGLTLKQCATRTGRSTTAVANAIERAGGRMRTGGPSPRPVDIRAMAAAYQAGATINGLAAQHHVSAPRLARLLRGAGVQINPPGPRPK
jgi:hypothetical protein